MMMGLKDDLIAAKKLIADPAKWRKGTYRDDGCYCAVGALRAAVPNPQSKRYMLARKRLHGAVDEKYRAAGFTVEFFNDLPKTTHADVMALFDRAIEATP